MTGLIFDSIKALGGAITKAPELASAYMALQTQAGEIVEQNWQITKELQETRAKLAAAEEALAVKGRVRYGTDRVWLAEESVGETGPYCIRCWESARKLARLIPSSMPNGDPCAECSGCGRVRPPSSPPPLPA